MPNGSFPPYTHLKGRKISILVTIILWHLLPKVNSRNLRRALGIQLLFIPWKRNKAPSEMPHMVVESSHGTPTRWKWSWIKTPSANTRITRFSSTPKERASWRRRNSSLWEVNTNPRRLPSSGCELAKKIQPCTTGSSPQINRFTRQHLHMRTSRCIFNQ